MFKNDQHLIDIDANERAISHRLAIYMEKLFPSWHVDCEYNRDLEKVKSIHIPEDPISWDDTDAKTVYPDIIVHRRGKNDNLLVIEMKKNREDEFDIQKLKAYKFSLHYQYAVKLVLNTGSSGGNVKRLEFID